MWNIVAENFADELGILNIQSKAWKDFISAEVFLLNFKYTFKRAFLIFVSLVARACGSEDNESWAFSKIYDYYIY